MSPRPSARTTALGSPSTYTPLTPTPPKRERRTAFITLLLCAVSYALFVSVVFSLKEMLVGRSGGTARALTEGVGYEGVGAEGFGRGRRMFVNMGH